MAPPALSLKAHRIATAVITGIHGPRPVAKFGPAGEGPRTNDTGITESQFLCRMRGLADGRKWDRRVNALAKALATEARRIEDRAVVRPMQLRRVRPVARRSAAA